jgi:hypothetical protein
LAISIGVVEEGFSSNIGLNKIEFLDALDDDVVILGEI